MRPHSSPDPAVETLEELADVGAIAVYKAIKSKDTNNDKVVLVIGPWHHGREILDGSTLGPLKFNSDTALYFREEISRPISLRRHEQGRPRARVRV